MNILFLTLGRFNSIASESIYSDLMREFCNRGHLVYIVSPNERKLKKGTEVKTEGNARLLYVKTLNIQKTNIIEKGLGTISIEYLYLRAIKKYFKGIKFDLIIYSTPPITFSNVVKTLKKWDGAMTYLLLKDIFPQNAVDLEMFSNKSIFYKYFRRKEKQLYAISDYIGCMSPANVKFVLDNNKEISIDRVEVNPNSIDLSNNSISSADKQNIREKYNLPINKRIFIYGGNLGKPQGLDFLIKALTSNINRTDLFFLIVGSGTEYQRILRWFEMNNPQNAKLMKALPKEDYDKLVSSCDVGLIFLDPRFTIPNYPSRLLSYLENKMPILAATDKNTDIGTLAEENGYGYWCENGNVDAFNSLLNKYTTESIANMGEKGYKYLVDNYTVKYSYETIMKHFKQNNV